MKTVFVVLLPLFIGFNSGVIAPSDAKAINKTLSETNRDDPQKNMTDINLEKSNRIDERELFQTPGKESTLNERSFIFINRRRSKALRNRISPTHILNKPFSISGRSPQVNAITSSSVQDVNNHKQFFVPNVWKMGLNPWYAPPKYNYSERDHKSWYMDYIYSMKNKYNQMKPKLSTANNKSQNNNGRPINFNVNTTLPPKNVSHASSHLISCDGHTSTLINKLVAPYDMPNSAYKAKDSSYIMREGVYPKANMEQDVSSHWSDDNDSLLERYIKETLQDFFRNGTMDFDNP